MIILWKTIGSFIAIVAFSLLIETPKRYVCLAGVAGGIGGIVYALCTDLAAWGVVSSSFISAVSIAVISHTFARVFKAPVTIFLIAGILPTVPGAGMYRIVYYSIQGNTALTGYYLVQTLEIAGVIALAIFLVDSLFRVFQRGFKQNSLKY